jgi:HEPN/Toprim N-terminal domain 1
MGSYTDLSIGTYSVHTYKSRVDPIVMTIFRETDKVYRVVSYASDGNAVLISTSNYVPTVCRDQDERAEVAYLSTVAAVKQRLEVMGFTLAESARAFDDGVAENVEELRQYEQSDVSASDFWNEEIRTLELLSLAVWQDAFADLKRRDIYSWNLDADFMNGEPVRVTQLQRYMLRDDREHWFGFPNVDFRYFLRAALEVCDLAEVVEQDLSALVGGGYYSLEAKVAEESRRLLLGDVPANAPILVLTEGSTDAYAIEGALSVLDPHLVGYYSFLNFSATNVPGGASTLVGFVKAFAGAGVANRVVALFDNDTAAHSALRVLNRVTLPPNVRVLTYPAIDGAKNYPTIGPGGVVEVDVNGLAGSVEMYFGRDVLTAADGYLTPIQWRGLDPALNRFHGEILEKTNLQERFKAKIAAARSLPDGGADWTGMRAILDALHRAFLT